MRLIQFILSIILLGWLLVVAWPLFLILAVILIVTWVNFFRKIKNMHRETFHQETFANDDTIEPTVNSEDIIDAEYKEKEI